MSLVKRNLAKQNNVAPTSTVKANAPKMEQNGNNMQTEYALFKAAINSDLAQLKTFGDISDKADYKAQALRRNEYVEYINKYRLSGDNHPNLVLAWVFIWLVDLKRWSQAIDLLPLLIEQKQPLPKQFNTKHWPTFLIDQLYDDANWHLQNPKKPDDIINITFVLHRVIHATKHQEWIGSEIAGGKLYAIATKLEAAQHNYGNALRLGQIAQHINDKAGVKTLVAKLEKQFTKLDKN